MYSFCYSHFFPILCRVGSKEKTDLSPKQKNKQNELIQEEFQSHQLVEAGKVSKTKATRFFPKASFNRLISKHLKDLHVPDFPSEKWTKSMAISHFIRHEEVKCPQLIWKTEALKSKNSQTRKGGQDSAFVVTP